MRVTWSAGTDLTFRLHPEDEITGRASDEHPIKLAINSCSIGGVPGDAHPDLYAVAAWTIVAPWTRRRITFDRAVSAELAQALHDGWGSRRGRWARSPGGPGPGWRSPTAAARTPWRRPRSSPRPRSCTSAGSPTRASRTAGRTTAPTCWPSWPPGPAAS
ncbi:hypothetical protein ACFQ0B_21185 [Nonomuraea thailandensis]